MAGKTAEQKHEIEPVKLAKLRIHKANKKLNDCFQKHIDPKVQKQIDQLLEDDIKASGLNNPLIVNDRYEILCGFRRFQILKRLKYAKVPVQIRRDLTPDEEKQLIINDNTTQRPIEGAAWIAIWETYYPDFHNRVKLTAGKRGVQTKEVRTNQLPSSKIADDFQMAASTVRGIIYRFNQEARTPPKQAPGKAPETVPIEDVGALKPLLGVFSNIIDNVTDAKVIESVKVEIGNILKQLNSKSKELAG